MAGISSATFAGSSVSSVAGQNGVEGGGTSSPVETFHTCTAFSPMAATRLLFASNATRHTSDSFTLMRVAPVNGSSTQSPTSATLTCKSSSTAMPDHASVPSGAKASAVVTPGTAVENDSL